MMACKLSEQLTGFTGTGRVKSLIEKYNLPVSHDVNKQEALEVLKMDKKKDTASMNYVLLEDIGRAVVMNIPMEKLEELITVIP
jgi:3-dehydroquinate synthase